MIVSYTITVDVACREPVSRCGGEPEACMLALNKKLKIEGRCPCGSTRCGLSRIIHVTSMAGLKRTIRRCGAVLMASWVRRLDRQADILAPAEAAANAQYAAGERARYSWRLFRKR